MENLLQNLMEIRVDTNFFQIRILSNVFGGTEIDV